jgi:GrpB-like predicted nucleotidyltransferase (UPF0157 family)
MRTCGVPESPEPLGLAKGTVRVAVYDARWPALYAAEAERLRDALARNGLTLELEHSGSTAVPGLAAKPIIDILAGRAPDSPRQRLIEVVESAGYTYRGEQEIPGRDFFRRGTPRSYHLHLTTIGSDFWRDHRTFRDRLRADPALRDEYATLKLELARRYPTDRPMYIDAKGPFVLRVLRGG